MNNKILTVHPKINSYLKPTKTILFPSKTVTVFYKIIEIIFALNFGFIKTSKNKWRYLPIFYCFFICMSSVVASVYYSREDISIWHLYNVTQYMVFIIILYCSDNRLYDQFVELGNVDLKLSINSADYKSDVKFLIPVIFASIFIFNLILSHCTIPGNFCVSPVWSLLVSMFLPLCHDIILIIISFAFYSVSLRLAKLLDKLENGLDLLQCIEVYKSIADIAENIKRSFDLMILTALLSNIAEMMGSTYFMVLQFQSEAGWIQYWYLKVEHCLSVSQTFLVTIGPALFAGRLCTLTNEIKIRLHHRLLQEQDSRASSDIETFILYVDARPLKFCIYKLIPLNTELLGMVIRFYVTYLIVIIQFTHVY